MTEHVLAQLRAAYPGIATEVIRQYQDRSQPENQAFAADPDNPAMHERRWHQYGIITHSVKFQEALQGEVWQYLREWRLDKKAHDALDEEIDGQPKRVLLPIAALFHDIGKFAARTPKGFRDHEVFSGQIVRSLLAPRLRDNGLTDNQIEYIARCTELHFELGKVRRAAKKTGYTFVFAESTTFKNEVANIQKRYKDFALEIGLFFLSDNLSKIEITAQGSSDDELEAQRQKVEYKIAERDLHPNLVNAALQLPINIKVAESYLRQWAIA